MSQTVEFDFKSSFSLCESTMNMINHLLLCYANTMTAPFCLVFYHVHTLNSYEETFKKFVVCMYVCE